MGTGDGDAEIVSQEKDDHRIDRLNIVDDVDSRDVEDGAAHFSGTTDRFLNRLDPRHRPYIEIRVLPRCRGGAAGGEPRAGYRTGFLRVFVQAT